MKKATLVAMMAALLMMLTGCKQLDRGTVVGKEYDDPDMGVMLVGKTVVPVRHPERFILIVEGKNEKGETVTEEWSVPESIYNAYGIGDFIVRPTE